MEKKKILVVEDEPSIADNISYALSTEGFTPHCCGTGEDALRELSGGDVALVVLDLGLPDVSGFELLRDVRKTSSVPLIVVTARSQEIDRIVGLEIGADDYVVKPVSPRELTARVRAVLRRSAGEKISGDRAVKAGAAPFDLDETRYLIRYHGVPLDLSRYEFRLRRVPLRAPG